tara:strand:- start:179 stop:2113 length:1935 start_codon:yes stop_codon:yes gene_type:complete
MEKIIVELEAKTNKALKGIDGVAKSVEKLNKEVVNSNKDTASGLKGIESASKSVGKGLKSVGSGLKALGIGLVIASLSTLKDLFSQNQKVVDTFNIVFETAAQVVGQVSTAFTDIYKSLSQSAEQFDALGKVVGGIVTIALTPFKNAFYAIQLAVQSTQLAWEKSVFGDKDPKTIEALNKSILETKVNIIEVGNAASKAGLDVVDNFGEAITEVGEASKVITKELGEISVKAAVDTATANVELKKSSELAAAKQGLLFEKFDRQAEKLRQVRDEERNSIEDRKKANDELLIKINAAEKGMLREAQMQLTLANANLKKDKNNTEFKVAQIEALKEVAGVEAQIEGIRSEQKANDLALDRESIELLKSKTESEINLEIEKKKFAAEQILEGDLRLEKLIQINESEKIIQEQRLQAIVDEANAGTQAKIDAQIALDEFTNTNNEENITLKRELLEKEISLEEKRVQSKQQALNQIAGLFGAESAMGKAALVAKQLIAAQELLIDLGAIKSKATRAIVGSQLNAAESGGAVATGLSKTLALGFPAAVPALIGYVAAAAGIVSGVMAATKKTQSLAGSLGGGGGGSTQISAPVSPPVPPSFNVVGQSNTNQLADAIGGQSKVPQRAYVVSGDVSTSQELDRNIIKSASI